MSEQVGATNGFIFTPIKTSLMNQLSCLLIVISYCLLIYLPGELRRIRSEFVKGVSDPVIKALLDDLYHHEVFSSEEKDYVMAERTKADQARCLIDMVMGKGEKASHVMIDSMKKRDQHLCSTLGLMSSLAGVGELFYLLFKETVSASFVLTRGELLCPLIHWDPVIHYHPLGMHLYGLRLTFFER